MKLCIKTSDIIDQEVLRTLLIDAANELTGGESQLLEPKLPWDGHPILVADAGLHPVLISFDPVSSQSALLNGLQATEQIATALPWVNQVYAALGNQQRSPRLVVISLDPPPGAAALLVACPGLRLFSYKVLKINEETGLYLEPVGTSDESTATMPSSTRAPIMEQPREAVKGPVALSQLSEEEKNYFQQL